MKNLSSIYDLLLEGVESYPFELESNNVKMIKYSFEDVVGNRYLVEFKNIPILRTGDLSTTYELLYFVLNDDHYSVSKVVNVNPYRVLKTVFGDILNDFTNRFSWIKNIYFVGLAKEREREYISSRTKMYVRYLTMNPIPGYRLQNAGNSIKLTKI
jgi:hypothetical protein